MQRLTTFIVPPKITEDDVVNIAACVDGKATPEQAKRAIDWIMREAARVADQPFQLGGEDGRRATDFAAGRMYVGHLIREMLHPATMSKAKGNTTP